METKLPFTPEDVDMAEVCRYLGIRSGEPDPETGALIEECMSELMSKIRPRSFYRVFPLSVSEDGTVDLTCFTVRSNSLMKNLRGCSQVLLFAATLGDGPDFLIRRYKRTEMTRTLILQAVSATMTEALCDSLNRGWESEYGAQGYKLRKRFSPGYGDFALENQRLFMDVLQMEKTVGIRLTDGCLMLPTKSVTAVLGMEKDDGIT